MKLNPKTLYDIVPLETKDAADILMKSIMDFKRRKRYNRFIQLKPVAPLLMKGGMKATFFGVVEQLERLRALVFFLEPTKYYRLVSEFVMSANNIRFYPVRHVFGEGYLQEEFLERVEGTITWICDVCTDNEAETPSIMTFISTLKEKIKVLDINIDYRSKDWYCIKAIMRFAELKGWEEAEFLGKLKNFYASRRKKTTAELVLTELVRGDIDETPISKKEEKKIKYAKTVKISELE